jgi:hypothetical protein
MNDEGRFIVVLTMDGFLSVFPPLCFLFLQLSGYAT